MPRERTRDAVFNIVLACIWLVLIVLGFGAINYRADNLLALYVLVAATATALFIQGLWKRRSS